MREGITLNKVLLVLKFFPGLIPVNHFPLGGDAANYCFEKHPIDTQAVRILANQLLSHGSFMFLLLSRCLWPVSLLWVKIQHNDVSDND